jgi:hypothetical protein
VHPRRLICMYAGGAVASGGIILIQELLQLNLFQEFASSIASICSWPLVGRKVSAILR